MATHFYTDRMMQCFAPLFGMGDDRREHGANTAAPASLGGAPDPAPGRGARFRRHRESIPCGVAQSPPCSSWRVSQTASVRPAEAACGPKLFDGAAFTVCGFDPRHDDLRLFWKGSDDKPFGSLAALALAKALKDAGVKLVFAMNAGMFQEDQSPMGLYVEKSQIVHARRHARRRRRRLAIST